MPSQQSPRTPPRSERPPYLPLSTRRHPRRLSFSVTEDGADSRVSAARRSTQTHQHRIQTDFTELEREVIRETGLRLFVMKRQKKKEYWQFIRLFAKYGCNVSDDNLTNADVKKAYCWKRKSIIDFRIGKSMLKSIWSNITHMILRLLFWTKRMGTADSRTAHIPGAGSELVLKMTNLVS
ncbi:hypothetical protein PC116_g8961 [Phytophthora cactorum]|nr:hypothetical protein PC116_g8961 [Phytophthora cactorum]